jgi:hypothetical protein
LQLRRRHSAYLQSPFVQKRFGQAFDSAGTRTK